MGDKTPVVAVSNTPLSTPTPGAGTSGWAQSSSAQSIIGNGNNPYFLPTNTSTTDTAQTSPQDIASLVNSAMQQLVGRFATPAEIAMYGKELLAAQRANPGTFTGQTTYQVDSGKRNTVTGATVSSGVNPSAFFENLIRGTAEAAHYRVINGYLGALQQLSDSSKVG